MDFWQHRYYTVVERPTKDIDLIPAGIPLWFGVNGTGKDPHGTRIYFGPYWEPES